MLIHLEGCVGDTVNIPLYVVFSHARFGKSVLS